MMFALLPITRWWLSRSSGGAGSAPLSHHNEKAIEQKRRSTLGLKNVGSAGVGGYYYVWKLIKAKKKKAKTDVHGQLSSGRPGLTLPRPACRLIELGNL